MDASPSDLTARLRGVHVDLRRDLDVSRHVFRDEVSYVVRDRLTFQNHRFHAADYALLVRIHDGKPLGALFDELVADGTLGIEDEGRFYAFILDLHRAGLLQLPVSDEKLLYRRLRARRAARRRGRPGSWLFLRVPLWNPDAFLERTVPAVRPLLSRGFFAAWCVLIASAVLVCGLRTDALSEPVGALLTPGNLPVMWLSLILLKVLHEFGHAYTCKHFGGHVPEMGAYFIAGTPCAYVDATDSWGFTARRHRLYVCLAGVYVELFVAGLATWVWALSSVEAVRVAALNVMFLASVTTLLFNINPLMRYDGYYLLSDLLGVPNLRGRANASAQRLLKRVTLGIRSPRTSSTGADLLLAVYGIAAALYRMVVILGIAALIASRFLVLGIAVAAYFLITTGYGIGRRLFDYLCRSDETAPIRGRAVATGGLLAGALVVGLLLAPVRRHVYAPGQVGRAVEAVVRVGAPGFVEAVHVRAGESVAAGAPLAELVNDEVELALLAAEVRLADAHLRREAEVPTSAWRAQRAAAQIPSVRQQRDLRAARAAALRPRAPIAGVIAASLESADAGRFLEEGAPLATVVSGGWTLEALLDEWQVAASQPSAGDRVRFRSEGDSGHTITGVVRRVELLGEDFADALPPSLASRLPVDPVRAERTKRPYFRVLVELDARSTARLRRGGVGQVQFSSRWEPLGLIAYRSLLRFVGSVRAGHAG